jgi:signal transduction histidine kinase
LVKKAQQGDKEAKIEASVLGQALDLLRASKPARLTRPKDAEEERALQRAQLLTAKPVLYVCNVDEGEAAAGNAHSERVFAKAAAEGAEAVVISAAQPIWVGNEVHGAVVVEETTNRIASLRSLALERLLVVTLAAFALVAVPLLWFATRLSSRIRRLRDEAEAAIDGRGRVTRLTTASEAGDEIGDLSRSFTTVLGRLARYNAYLEALAGRLSHELRTPVAVVRSSLENLHGERTPEETRTYVARAEEGLARLGAILSRMTGASRLEQGLSTAERERFDAAAVVRLRRGLSPCLCT